MNLRVLRPSRRRPKEGDIFVLQPTTRSFVFGRVIITGANAGGFPNSNLVYIYRATRRTKAPLPVLSRKELLLPPLMTNNLPWVRGYFEFVEHRELLPSDRLARHVFRDDRGWCFDEHGDRVSRAIEPVGEYGLHSFLSIDDAVSEAMGLPVE